MKEVYVVYGVDADELSGYSYRSCLGRPNFISVFDTREAAVAYFRMKVLSIARNKALNERFFSHLTDEELFVDTYMLREYEDDEIAKLPVFIGYDECKDKLSWEFYKDDIDYDLIDPMPPRVYLRKRIVWLDEVEQIEDE